MATTSDSSSPPLTSSESMHATQVQVHDNGVLAGTQVVNTDGTWQLLLNNLTQGSHIMTASSDGTTSNPWAVNVTAASGSEDWADVPAQLFPANTFYVCPSGLIIIIYNSSPTPNWEQTQIKTINGRKVLDAGNPPLPSTALFSLFFPVPAARITINVEQGFHPLSGSKMTFFSDNNFTTEHVLSDNDGLRGEHTYRLNGPVRLVRFEYLTFSATNPNMSSIRWSND